MKEYVMLSIETHLFFARIMKEHALFLLASFPEKEEGFRKRADWFRAEFEEGLRRTVELSDGMIEKSVLDSGEIVTRFTKAAECQTSRLTGIPIDIELTQAQMHLCGGCSDRLSRKMVYNVRMLNRKMLGCLNGLIAFKEEILQRVLSCRLYTSNYPLLIEHILREAKLYRQLVVQLEKKGRIAVSNLRNVELFWNQIMMEHAQFIRGLLDPTECELMKSADKFAEDYCNLLEEAKEQDSKVNDLCNGQSFELTKEFRQFKAAGTEGLVDCKIRSIILPLLSDHVLREANHYLRLLETAQRGRDRYGFV